MYPVGIRVVKVAGVYEGVTATVVAQVPSDPPLRYTDDMVVIPDTPVFNHRNRLTPPGHSIGTHSKYWRPINPDADEKTEVTEQELEEVL